MSGILYGYARVSVASDADANYNLSPSRWVGQATNNGYADIGDIISRFESITVEEAAVSADLNTVLQKLRDLA